MHTKTLAFRLLTVTALALALCGAPRQVQAVVDGYYHYAKATSTDSTGDCESWAAACTLQRAIGVATSGDQVWVAEGTYWPTVVQSGTDRWQSFLLESGVAIYGGFAGTETEAQFSLRDPAAHPSILSGEIGDPNSRDDNSYHVVSGTSLPGSSVIDSSSILDGFTITRGKTPNDNATMSRGSGLRLVDASPTLRNLVFTDNQASLGGAMSCEHAYGSDVPGSNPTLTDVTFTGNSGSGGGAMYNAGSSPILINVTFTGNSSVDRGGAMYNSGSSPSLTNVTFQGNIVGGGTSGSGGAMHNLNGSNPTLSNVTMSGNSALWGLGIHNESSSPVIYNSIFWNNAGDEQVYSDFSSQPTVIDSIVRGGCPYRALCTNFLNADPKLGALADNGGATQTMALGAGSPAINAGGVNHACPDDDQRDIPRPQGPACDIGAYEAPVTMIFKSYGPYDGWVLESSETSRAGGTKNVAGPTFNLGDNAADRQYRAILSFNTAALPENADIRSVKLRIQQSSVVGTNPFSTLTKIQLDIREGAFGTASGLELVDFSAAASKLNAASILNGPAGGWYSKLLPSTAFPFINVTGVTQFRLRFYKDDNDNRQPDYLVLWSGNAPIASSKPQLQITYYEP